MLKGIFNILINNAKHLKPKFKMMAEVSEGNPDLLGKRPADPSEAQDRKKQKKKKKQHQVQLGQTEGFKRKIALLIAYNGDGYYGVQVNPGYPTIESEFFPALVKIEAIPEDHATTLSKMWFQRGSRTDKGVSAVGQIFSMKAVLVPDFVKKLNENLPSTIRVMGYIRTTNGFDSKNFCCARTYMYMIPTFAFAPLEEFVTDEYRVTPEIIKQVREVLMKFLGTHKFHNYTSGVKFEQASASRYIIKFECSEPFVRDDLEFVTLRVKGQSFMLHHIRKMIGMTIAIVRGFCAEKVLEACWGPERVDVPKAPGLGLVLEELHFDGYNKKFGKDGVHEPIDWSQYQDEIEKFKEEQIISQIVVKEKTERVTFNWLRTLKFHNFDTPRTEGPQKPWARVMKMLEEKSDQNEVASCEETGVAGLKKEMSALSGAAETSVENEDSTTIIPLQLSSDQPESDVSQNKLNSEKPALSLSDNPSSTNSQPITSIKDSETVAKLENT